MFLNISCWLQGRIPGTDRWRPVSEAAGAEEDTPGVLIVRIRDNLDFGSQLLAFYIPLLVLITSVLANTAQLKGD